MRIFEIILLINLGYGLVLGWIVIGCELLCWGGCGIYFRVGNRDGGVIYFSFFFFFGFFCLLRVNWIFFGSFFFYFGSFFVLSLWWIFFYCCGNDYSMEKKILFIQINFLLSRKNSWAINLLLFYFFITWWTWIWQCN